MNVLFLSLEFVLPADRGLRVRTLTQLRLLSALASVERITVLSLRDVPVPDDRLRALERELPKVRAERPVFQPFHMRRHPRSLPRLVRLRFLHDVPYIVAKCDSVEMHAEVERHLQSRRYDVVYLGHLGMASYLPEIRKFAPRARVVLEQHNVEWEIFDRLATSFRPSMRAAVRWEARAVRRFEQRTMREVDSVIAISRADARAFRELAGVDAVVVPPFIEPRAQRVEESSAPALAYIGQLAWQPNVYGLDWLCRDVWPLVRERMPNAALTIAGPGLRRDADGALIAPPTWAEPGIQTIGFVEDLDDLYRGTLGMVAPVIGGSGVRMKLLEAFSAGMPTVTTTDGAAGLDVEDGRELLIADDPVPFAERVVRVLSERALRESMRKAGYAFLASHHSEAIGRARVARALGIASNAAEKAPLVFP